MKDVGLRIRVQRDLREKFLEVCRAIDKPAAQVLREFMTGYVGERKKRLSNENRSGGDIHSQVRSVEGIKH